MRRFYQVDFRVLFFILAFTPASTILSAQDTNQGQNLILKYPAIKNSDKPAITSNLRIGLKQNEDPYFANSIINGRLWYNTYKQIRGHQFFLSDQFITGNITFNGKTYNQLRFKYDILNDELIIGMDPYPLIMMNKEMVDSFSLKVNDQEYYFFNAGNDSSSILKGYISVLYNGSTALLVKQKKMIQPLAVDGKYDMFYDEFHVFIRKNDEIIPINSKKSLYNNIAEKEKDVKEYMKQNGFRINKKDPYSYIPALRYYDKLSEKR
jgi:hypothetical protein